jgi:glycerol transport system ATP-binding protein
MTVRENLSFPLRNRGVDEETIATRVAEIAAMLELDSMLDKKAAGLTPDNKQKISLGRGLVRDDVNVIMFDEPLTVIDPHLKWKLRSKLKELHQKVNRTMIYVTHDQTEALTFADQVVVMNFGQVLQVGTPVELFERPTHTFVGHFIGSPGMNVLPASVVAGSVQIAGHTVDTASDIANLKQGTVEVGVRPEFVRFTDSGIPGAVETVMDVGRHTVVKVKLDGLDHSVNVIVDEGDDLPEGNVHLQFEPAQTRLYEDGWIVAETQG